MKKLFIEIFVIVTVSICASLIFNFSSESPLPVFNKYVSGKTDLKKPETGSPEIEIISLEVLEFLMIKEKSLLLDARPFENYRNGHIPGSFSFPEWEFEKIFREKSSILEPAKTIIIYCSDANCEDSVNLAIKLQNRGFSNIFVYKSGFEEWVTTGKEIEQDEK